MWDTLHCAAVLASGRLSSLESLLNVNEHSHSMCKQPAESAPRPKTRLKNKNVKRAAPVEILKPHPIRTIHWKRRKTGLFKNVEYKIGKDLRLIPKLSSNSGLVNVKLCVIACSLTNLGSDGIISSFYAFLALIPWFSTGSMVSLIPSFITYPKNQYLQGQPPCRSVFDSWVGDMAGGYSDWTRGAI
jgi:hypothetical protein